MLKKLAIFGLLLALVAGMQPFSLAKAAWDGSYWTTGGGHIDLGQGKIIFDVPHQPANTWDKMWGKYLSARKDKMYVVRFRAKADSHTGASQVPISLRLQQAYSPWRPYSEVKVIHLNSSPDYYEVRLYSSISDHNAEITAHLGHAAADYRFSDISISQESPDREKYTRPLDSDYWSRPAGAMNYGHGEVNVDVRQKPAHLWEFSWGHNFSTDKHAEYMLSFDAWAGSHTNDPDVPISVRIQKSHSPYTLMSKEEIVYLDNDNSHYEIVLKADRSEHNASIVVWLGHARAEYHFANISVNRIKGGEPAPQPSAALSYDYWANPVRSINYKDGTLEFDVQNKPGHAYDASFGRHLPVYDNENYVVRFRARAESYTSRDHLPVTIRLQQNHYPWTAYSGTKTVYVGENWSSHELHLTSREQYEYAMASIWAANERGKYYFRDIEITRE